MNVDQIRNQQRVNIGVKYSNLGCSSGSGELIGLPRLGMPLLDDDGDFCHWKISLIFLATDQ